MQPSGRNTTMTQAIEETDAQRWAAIVQRDRRADGQFYYAVQTTGVYCYPSCAARRARRENVRFFTTAQDAERAGFRPCKRCRPDTATPAQRYADIVTQACRLIEASQVPPSLADLAKISGISSFHFHRIFKRITGVTPKAYATGFRAMKIRAGLGQSDTITRAIYDAGFNSSGRFYEDSTAILGMVPRLYRDGGTGIVIRFAIADCSLGTILVAATDKGIVAIQFGTDPERLVHELQDRFPNARLRGGDADFDKIVAHVVGFVELPQQRFDLPLDVRGTAFQQRVWQALRQIPLGKTASYAEIARQIGNPTAARAVARACAANQAAVVVPCHRVVRSDGQLSGYRWGIARKRDLLRREGAL
ncbi:MAG: bifunctional DNA-binding transcriptional regulator/O6-methylguanine-DNA methyltransferase Ada [Acidiphilium sp.]|nr:bifunctional DNA-binding transcriptional regulator/O6-methylguanine-DNA methyltransferase Ada [Acidiphilium sp.]MDD4936666.1 bifunctional DNA-binding transcriptional regulator/O6-methylguanine-DNA methyltransferase Ada [Acidiphilium sp.]